MTERLRNFELWNSFKCLDTPHIHTTKRIKLIELISIEIEMSEAVNELLKNFIIEYVVKGHTATEEALNWIDSEIDKFLNDWDHELRFGFVVPLWSCIERVREVNDPNDYKSFYTLYLDEYRLREILKRIKRFG